MKASRSEPKRLSLPAKAGLVLVILAATGYAVARYNGLLPWDKAKAATTTQAAMASTSPAPEPKAPASRIVRVSPANPRVIDHVRLSTAELLDPNFALFDPAALTLSPPRRLLDEIERPLLLAEVVNRSDGYIALSPDMTLSVFDGSRPLRLRQEWSLPAMLYPGERIPVRLQGEDFERYSEVKTDWQPAKRAALPGTRPKLDVTIDSTEAAVGTGTLNFTYRFRYKYVVVHGRVRNDDKTEVQNVKVWVSLYDAQDKLSGAQYSELRLPKLQPGESAPFKVDVKQYGGNFARVAVVYDAKAN